MRVAAVLCLLSLWGFVSSQEGFYRVPDALVQQGGGAVTFRTPEGNLTYIEGLGWREPSSLGQPLLTPEGVFAPADLLEVLGITQPTLSGVRFGGSGTVRVVLDLTGISEGALALEQRGRLAEGEVLRLELPELLLPQELPDPYRGVALELVPRPGATEVQLSAGEASYHAFSLSDPTRLVIDVTPHAEVDIEARSEVLRPGVLYRHFASPTAIGSSEVHVLEMAPGSGEFRVVGASENPQTVSALSSGAFAAINAGYFDTRSYDAIGLLKVDYGLLSLPSRRRASIGFGFGQAVIDRVETRVTLSVDGQRFAGAGAGQDALRVVTESGQVAGLPTQGVITVARGRVLDNRVGPVAVPEDGFAVVYEPDQRELALVEPGAAASFNVQFEPQVFEGLRYAVEAGPLLVANGLPAFQPDEEEFRRGERILDEYTQQAAVGVKADGTVLFVVANNMIAEELVPLMLSLGATEAMRLDSGGSTTLVVDGKVVNRSSERKVISAIVFLPTTN